MGRLIALLMLVCLSGGSGLAWAAADLEEGVKELADKITKSMVEKGTHKIAIVDFSDLNGTVTALGQFLAEELTTQLFQLAPGKFEVVERRQLLRLEEELVLGQLGVLDEKTLKQMGKVLGVEAIVTGSMADLGNMIKVNARMIAVETAKVFAVAATSIPKTGLVADLASKLVERKAASPAPAGTGGAAPTSKGAKVPTVKPEVVEDFRFDLQRCAKQSSKIVCTLLVTNLKEDRLLTLKASDRSRLFDTEGNEYPAKACSLGNKASDYYVQSTMVQNVPTRATLSFEGAASVSGISLLEIVAEYDHGKGFLVKFRNVPLSE